MKKISQTLWAGGPAFEFEFAGGNSFVAFEGARFRLSDSRITRHFKIHTVAVSPFESSLVLGRCVSDILLCRTRPRHWFHACTRTKTALALGHMSDLRNQIDGLSPAEKAELLDKLWESLEADSVSLTAAQRAELDYRIARHEQNPSDVIPWEQVRAGLFKKP